MQLSASVPTLPTANMLITVHAQASIRLNVTIQKGFTSVLHTRASPDAMISSFVTLQRAATGLRRDVTVVLHAPPIGNENRAEGPWDHCRAKRSSQECQGPQRRGCAIGARLPESGAFRFRGQKWYIVVFVIFSWQFMIGRCVF